MWDPRNGVADNGDSLSDYDDTCSSYWPLNWDFVKWRSCPDSEILSLPEDERERLRVGFLDVLGQEGLSKLMELRFPPLDEDDGLSDIKPNWLTHYKGRVQKDCKWGFVGFRTCYYEDEERWTEYRRRLDEIVRLHMRETAKRFESAQEADEKFEIRWVEGRELGGADAKMLRVLFRGLESTLSPEMCRRVFFVATPQSVMDVLKADMPTKKSKMWRSDAPYVVAVSTIGADEMSWEEGHEELEWHKEVFKVAAEMVIEELWHTLEGMEWSVARTTGPWTKAYRLEQSEIVEVSEQPHSSTGIVEDIWWSTSPSPARMEQRRRRRFGDG